MDPVLLPEYNAPEYTPMLPFVCGLYYESHALHHEAGVLHAWAYLFKVGR